jgi:hypothetical protein
MGDIMKRVLAVLIGVGWPLAVSAAPPVDPALCRQLPVHRPAPDVAYKPGVDVHGKAVVPADLPRTGSATPTFEIPLSLGLARQLNLPVPSSVGGLPQTAEVGRIAIAGGQVYFNGEPMGGAAQDELVTLCGQRR